MSEQQFRYMSDTPRPQVESTKHKKLPKTPDDKRKVSLFTANEYDHMLVGETPHETLDNAEAHMRRWCSSINTHDLIIRSPDEFSLIMDYRMQKQLMIATGISKAHKEVEARYNKQLSTNKGGII